MPPFTSYIPAHVRHVGVQDHDTYGYVTRDGCYGADGEQGRVCMMVSGHSDWEGFRMKQR